MSVRRCLVSLAATVLVCTSTVHSQTIFFDHFEGNDIDRDLWLLRPQYEQGTVTVANSIAAVNSAYDVGVWNKNHFYMTANLLNFSASPTNWYAEIRFKIDSLSVPHIPAQYPNQKRDFQLLSGCNDVVAVGEENWAAQGIDVRIKVPSEGNYSLGWHGWDSQDRCRGAIDLNTPISLHHFYTVTVHRKPDGYVDILLDGQLVSTQPLIGWQNPDRLRCGDATHYQTAEFSIDYIKIEAAPVTVDIDIKPGSDPNSINLGSQGVVPVAILSSADFDATTVDPDTVTLGGAGVAVRGKGNKYMAHQEDVNADGLTDLVCQVETENLDPDSFQDGYAILTGSTYDGQDIEGTDEIRIVPE